MPPHHHPRRLPRMRPRERGATLLSVMLLVLALLAAALLGIRSSQREAEQAGAQVARERAQQSASAALALARVRLEALPPGQRNQVLGGSRPQGPHCPDPCRDCVPRDVELVADDPHGPTCLAPPCVRPGAIARLPDASGARVHWCDLPLRQLLPQGDAEARVSVWVRNDRADGLDGGGWRNDQNGRVVLTATAELRGARVVASEEVALRNP